MTQQLERSLPARSLRNNVRWNLVGNVAYALGQWLQLIILARMGGPAAVGAYAFALALTAPVMMFASLCLRFMQATDAQRTYSFREYLSLRGATTVAALFAIAIIAWGTGAGRSVWAVLLPICAMRAADAISDVYYGIWQQHERMSVIAGGLVLNSVSSATFMTGAAVLGGGVPGAAIGSALGSCAALVFVHFRTASDAQLRRAFAAGSGQIAWRRVARLAAEATPLGFSILLGSLQQNVPRFFLQRYGGEAALGLFAAASQLTLAGDFVIGSLGAAAGPRLASLRASGDGGAFRGLTRRLVLAGALLGAAGVALSLVAGRWILELLYRPEFGSSARVLVVLSAAAGLGFVASLLCYVLSSARIFAVQPLLLAVALAMLIACCAALVPRYGGDGAALALLVASSAHALLSWLALRKLRREGKGIDGSRAAVEAIARPALHPAKVSPACRSIVLPGPNQ
jgi:O-antigen/teichoic acid export membrane protein